MTLSPSEFLPILKRHPTTFLLMFLEEKNLLPPLNLADIGAFSAKTSGDYPFPLPLYWVPRAKVHAFEAHPDNYRKLKTGLNQYPAEIIPHEVALGESEAKLAFHETIQPIYSSLCLPLVAPTQNFIGLEGMKAHRNWEVNTRSLDQTAHDLDIPPFAALAINTNGSELSILKGGAKSMKEAVFVSARIAFYPLYEHQANWGALESFLRENDFQFQGWRAPHHVRLEGTDLYTRPQLTGSEALFFPSLAKLSTLSPTQLLALAMFSSLYEALDLTEKALSHYDAKEKSTLLPEFREAFLHRFNPSQLKPKKTDSSPNYDRLPTVFLPIADGVKVAVPDTLELLTPYVLREQGDWFEVELPWLRRYLKPGMKVLDIGANYGVYSLALSQVVGPSGQVWAIEPTPQIFSFLKQSRDKNAFTQLQVFQLAMSLSQGEAAFYTTNQSEYNSLTPSGDDTGCIRVPTDTVDNFVQTNKITSLDFLKLDAEGEEVNIIEGGQKFFIENNPLVLVELRHGKRLNLDIVDKLESLGYHCYRLIPGLGVLTSFARHGQADQQTMNILACKAERAQTLHQEGLLNLPYDAYAEVNFPEPAFELYLSCFPYGKIFATRLPSDWVERFEGGNTYRDCLNAFCVSLLPSISPEKRVGLLEFAFEKLHALVEIETTLPRLLTLVRISLAWGRGEIAKNILAQLSQDLLAGSDFHIMEPFICPSTDFDLVDPQPNPALWCIGAVIHEHIRKNTFSTFYLPRPPLSELQKLEEIGYLLPSMRPRLELIRSRKE